MRETDTCNLTDTLRESYFPFYFLATCANKFPMFDLIHFELCFCHL